MSAEKVVINPLYLIIFEVNTVVSQVCTCSLVNMYTQDELFWQEVCMLMPGIPYVNNF